MNLLSIWFFPSSTSKGTWDENWGWFGRGVRVEGLRETEMKVWEAYSLTQCSGVCFAGVHSHARS